MNKSALLNMIVPLNKTVSLFDIDVANLTIQETVEIVINSAKERRHLHVVGINADKIVMSQHDMKLKAICQKSKLVHADGQSIVWASKLLKRPLSERVAGIDLMIKLFERAEELGLKVYLLGTKPDILQDTVQRIRSSYPRLIIAGYRDGYFTTEQSETVLTNIAHSNADLLFVGLPSPYKEYWLDEHGEQLTVPVMMGVGGSFDVLAGKYKRAPVWAQRCGLEWCFRMLQEPSRLLKRYLVGNLKFALLLLKERRHIVLTKGQPNETYYS